MAEHKISALSGIHCSDGTAYTLKGWRDPASWQRRLQEWIDDTNTFDPEVAIDLGDLVDAIQTTYNLMLSFLNGGDPSYLSIATDSETGFQMPRLNLLGNHIAGYPNIEDGDWADDLIWNGEDGKPTMADYFAVINNQTSGQSVTKENYYYALQAENPYGYTADIGGVRYIVVFFTIGSFVQRTLHPDKITWLTDILDNTSLPVVIVAHCHLWLDPNQPHTGWWRLDDPSTLYAAIDAYPVVQLVLGGHRHRHAYHYMRNGVHYLSVGGSVGIRQESDAGLKNNYAMITLDTEVIPTPYGMKANLKVVGTGTWAKSCSRVYDTFGVM